MSSLERSIAVLLVEDNPGDIELVRIGLESTKLPTSLQVISDGQEAIDFFSAGENLPDIVLLDVNLPKVDGFSILQKIKETPSTMMIPVVMLTSSAAVSDVHKGYENHVNSYIQKPVDAPKFLEAVDSIENFWMSLSQLPGRIVN